MSGPFKMKGSPMQRNFGIGSPMRDEEKVVKPAPPSDEEKVVKPAPPSKEELQAYNLDVLYQGDVKLSEARRKEIGEFESKSVQKGDD